MSIALTLTGIALASLAAAGLLTVIAVGVAETWMRSKPKEGETGNVHEEL